MSEFEFLRDVTIGQYLPTGSAFHRLDPRARLLMATFFLIGIVFGDSLTGLLAALAIVFWGLAWARIPPSYAVKADDFYCKDEKRQINYLLHDLIRYCLYRGYQEHSSLSAMA